MPNDSQSNPNKNDSSLQDTPPGGIPTVTGDLSGAAPTFDKTASSSPNNSAAGLGLSTTPTNFSDKSDPIVTSTPLANSSILNPTVVSSDSSASSQTPPPTGDSGNSGSTNSPYVPKKYGGKKMVATIFGVLLLMGSVVAGVLLVQRQQELREGATGGPGKIAVFKTMCNQIGQQDTCNGRDISLSDYKVDFKVHQGENDQGPVVQTITVALSDNHNGQGSVGNGSQGRKVGNELPLGKYTVCEVPVAYNSANNQVTLEVVPRPDTRDRGNNDRDDEDDDDDDGRQNRDDDDDDNDGVRDNTDPDQRNDGSTGGSNQQQFGQNCITVRLTPGEAELKFLDKRKTPVASPTPTVTPNPTIGPNPISCPAGTEVLFSPSGKQLRAGTTVALSGTIASQTGTCTVVTRNGVLLAQYCKTMTVNFANPVNLDTAIIFDNDPKQGEQPWSINGTNLTVTGGGKWASQKLNITTSQMVFNHGGDSSNFNVCVKTPAPSATSTPTPVPTATPTLKPDVIARCNDVKAYDLNNNKLSQTELDALKPGDKVRFAVSGQTNAGSFSKARFTVNNSPAGESMLTNSHGEFYIDYTIPQNATTISVQGEVYHSTEGWI